MKIRPVLRSVAIGVAVIVVVLIYAYAFTVTDVNFETTRSEQRLTNLTRILRALAHPDILEYAQEEQIVESPIYLPCPQQAIPQLRPVAGGPFLIVSPACGDARQNIEVEGVGLWPESKGPVNFIPPSGASLTIGLFETDSDGGFKIRAQLPNRQPLTDPQTLRAIARRNVGGPHLSPMADVTIDKILETVFLALLATTIGTILAVPISFVAARNLMEKVRNPLTSVSLSLVGWPLGIWLGASAAGSIGRLLDAASASMAVTVGGAMLSPLAMWGAVAWALPRGGTRPTSWRVRLVRGLLYVLIIGFFILFLTFLANLGLSFGKWLIEPLGKLGFLGNFVYQLGDSLRMITPVLAGLVGGAALGGLGGRMGQQASDRLDPRLVRGLNIVTAASSGVVLFALIGGVLDWFYQFQDPVKTLWVPAAAGAAVGVFLAVRAQPKATLPIGSSAYYITRTILNAIRSVEPLIMVIVFVVWVGIGPFAGALALGLHTVAALAKLFSEQVESILPGPLEAIQATGANRLQTIAFAVVPQVIPPYISFLMYRWDINVRMSTIIGFAGGGGIGFLLQQNIGILNYRAASTQMLAIAIVVATMDYLSSTLRQRFV